MSKQMLELLRSILDEVEVDTEGKCSWSQVANILPRMRGELRSSADSESVVKELAAWLIALEDASMYEPVPQSLIERGRTYIFAGVSEKHSGDCTKESHTCVVCFASDAIAKAMHLAQPKAALCDDCPPDGYPTDKTRCAPCPRRAPHCQAESALGHEAPWHTIAKHIACKKDCQARPSGCGCARDAANTIIRAMTAISPQHQGASNE